MFGCVCVCVCVCVNLSAATLQKMPLKKWVKISEYKVFLLLISKKSAVRFDVK